MTDPVHFFLDDKDVMAQPGETIWEVAKRTGTLIPHLCHRDAPGYRPDGNCRVCMLEIKGERVLAPSCLRTPLPGMQVWTGSERARKARRMVLELLLADQPPRAGARSGLAVLALGGPSRTWRKPVPRSPCSAAG